MSSGLSIMHYTRSQTQITCFPASQSSLYHVPLVYWQINPPGPCGLSRLEGVCLPSFLRKRGLPLSIRRPLPSVERVRANDEQRATIKRATSGSYERRATSDDRRSPIADRRSPSAVRRPRSGCSVARSTVARFSFLKEICLVPKTVFKRVCK